MFAQRSGRKVIGRPKAALLAALLAALAQLFFAPACAAMSRAALSQAPACHGMAGMAQGHHADHAAPAKAPAPERPCGHCFAPPAMLEAQPPLPAPAEQSVAPVASGAVAHSAPVVRASAAPPPSQAPPGLI